MADRQAYIDKQEAQRRELAAKIELLRARAAKADAQARITLNEQIEKLRSQEKKYAEKIGELKEAGGDAWMDLKDGVEKAWEELKGGIKAAADKFL
jgi:hypothetical protein